MIHKKFVQNLAQNSNLKQNVEKCERVEVDTVHMTTLAGGILVTNYHDSGRKVSKSSLDRGRKQNRPLPQTAVDT